MQGKCDADIAALLIAYSSEVCHPNYGKVAILPKVIWSEVARGYVES